MKKRLRLGLQIAVIAIVILSAVSLAGIASAQQSANFQLGCWGVATGGGGTRASTNFQLTDAFGQSTGMNFGGIALTSQNFQLRPGYAQNFSFLSGSATTTTATSITAPTEAITIFVPILNTYVAVVYNCPS